MVDSFFIDIVIPVYNEGENILPVLGHLADNVKTPFRVLLCYDDESDNTITAIENYHPDNFEIILVKNKGRGVHDAVMTGFSESNAPAVIVLPADDNYNGPVIDRMVQSFKDGAQIVSASRFMKGGCMRGCPWLKASLVKGAAFLLFYIARIPTHDPTNGFRLFSRKVINEIPVESKMGFAFSIELLVKCHRRGWKIAEVPASWFERKKGKSRFQILRWLPTYLRWLVYGFGI